LIREKQRCLIRARHHSDVRGQKKKKGMDKNGIDVYHIANNKKASWLWWAYK
jgi:hypothetical protein